MNYEVNLINSILSEGDIVKPNEARVDVLIQEHEDVWNFLVDFHANYGTLPTKDIVRESFKEFPLIKTEAPLDYYIDEARKGFTSSGIRRSIMAGVEELQSGGDPNAVLAHVQRGLQDISRHTNRLRDTDITDFDERTDILRNRILHPDDQVFGITSGVTVIDRIFGGWQPGDFVVVIGWTGVGKSALTRLFAANCWRAGGTPLVISLEMDKISEQYRMDTILNDGGYFTNAQITSGKDIDIEMYEAWAKHTYEGKNPIHLVTSDGIEKADQNFVRAKIEQYKPDLVVLDYHTLFEDANGGSGETERAKNLSKDFKRIAMQYRVPIIDVSGVTMESGHEDRPPELAEIAWSKQLVYDSDLVLAIHRPRDSNLFQIVSRKTRRCPGFAFYLDWDLNTGQWKEVFND